MENISLLATLRKSFSLIFSNLSVFVPYLLSIGLSFVLFVIPFSGILAQASSPDAITSLDLIVKIIILSVFGAILSLLTYGWSYAAIRPVVMGEKLDVFSELKPGMRLSLTLLLQFVIAGLVLIGMAIVAFLIGMLITWSYSVSLWLGIALTFIGMVIGLSILLFLCSVLMVASAALIVLRCGAWESITRGFDFCKAHMGRSLKMILLSILLMIAFYIPLFPFLVMSGDGAMVTENFIGYTALSTLLSLPSMVGMSAIFIFYGLIFKELSGVEAAKPAVKKSGAKKGKKKK